LVCVPELPGSRVSGATQWISASKAVLQLSIRYRTDDHFWFTLFHEAGHILLHRKKLIFLETCSSKPPSDNAMETEANSFASELLIPSHEYNTFVHGTVTERAIKLFASQIGVAPGIVVGRLQHDGYLPYKRFNRLKRRLRWTDAD
jgi:Zn-dependent peptidase ImmA (M78 family)